MTNFHTYRADSSSEIFSTNPLTISTFFLKIGLLTQISKFVPNVNIPIFNKSCKYILPITFQIQQSHVFLLFYRVNYLNFHVFKSSRGKMSTHSCSVHNFLTVTTVANMHELGLINLNALLGIICLGDRFGTESCIFCDKDY